MRRNAIPAVIAFAPGLLLPLTQNVVRPRIHHPALLVLFLASAPDFIAGFCFPFSAVIRPRAFTEKTCVLLFAVWSLFAAVMLVVVEVFSPFGPNVFDPNDIVAGIGGVALAALVFQTVLRKRLSFGTAEPEPQLTPVHGE